jgi:cytoskeletal protein RodZ
MFAGKDHASIHWMMVGTELRQARERAGLSVEEIGQRTKIQLYKIEALEQGDYDRLPQGIYLDGIVRSYSHEVKIDPEAMVERVRLERGKRPGDVEVPFSAPIDLHGPARPREVQFIDVPEIDDDLGSFATEKRPQAPPITRKEPVRQAEPVPPQRPVRQPQAAAPEPVFRYESLPPRDLPLQTEPLLRKKPPIVSRPPTRTAQRRAPALIPAIVVLAAAFLGGYAYQSWRLHERNDIRMSTTESVTENEIAPNGSATPSPKSPETMSEPPKTGANRSVPPDKVATTGSLPNVAGSWTLNTKVESSSYSRYSGLQLGYELRLEQKGDRVTGVGRKVAENGAPINKRAQTPLSVNGTVSSDRLTLNFVERGARRPSRGKFVLAVGDSETLHGRFSSSAASSSGVVEARRVATP